MNEDDDTKRLHTPSRYFFKQWREHRGMNQTQLAIVMGCQPATVSRIETGLRPFTQGYLEDFAAACSLPSIGTVLDRPPDKCHPKMNDDDARRLHFELADTFARETIRAVRNANEMGQKGPGKRVRRATSAKSA